MYYENRSPKIPEVRSNKMLGICDVCRLTLNDTRVKEVEYCAVCYAYICKECEFSSRRIVAFAKSKGMSLEQFRRLQRGGQ